MKLWVFDLDGTLVDTFHLFMAFITEKLGYEPNQEEKKIIVGLHPTDVFKRYFSEARSIELWQELAERGRTHPEIAKIFDGIPELLAELKREGREVAIWTNRDRESAARVLEMTGLHVHVDKLVSSDCVPARKPEIHGMVQLKEHFGRENHEIVMIGDHDMDMIAARSSGVTAVRAAWHGNWLVEPCERAHHQFDCSLEFGEWSRSALKSNAP